MIKEFLTKKNDKMLLKATYDKKDKIVAHKHGFITEFFDKNEAIIYLDSKKVKDYYSFANEIEKLIKNLQRSYLVDVETFVNEKLSIQEVIRAFVLKEKFLTFNLFNKKKEQKENKETIDLLIKDEKQKALFEKLLIVADNINETRNLQIMPENFCNSEYLANFIETEFKKVKELKVTVLDKKAIEKEQMGLLLSVNKGSTYEPRVVVIEYNGDPESKEKLVYVGKGITFDTGGVNTKGYQMEGMKFDMSGSVIVAHAVKAIAQLKLKKNVAAIMMITDNRLDGDASLPENVYTSMAGISVEVTDTDAEGRLVLADGLYYGATKLNATLLVDVATLTGSMVRALGSYYSGIYSTNDKAWKSFEQAAQRAYEKVWRMPMHEDFHEPNKASLVADLNNYNNSEKSDCNTAAMFLKEFTNDVDFIHCDVAGTADIKGHPQGVLVSTLVELASK
ncbi:M17 family metallopeptidase [Mycoplasmopsis hyopharyngis]|uniref:M17 family metallopeptidase n=1 Tax=Mycoplasmopsis hyopharyngis TaxID=29558 RepID=UPI00387309FB